jgi:hypothetical protein
MDFFLDKLDNNRAWLILSQKSSDTADVIAWRVDGYAANDPTPLTLGVIPVSAHTNSAIVGVLRIDLEKIASITLQPVREVFHAVRHGDAIAREVIKNPLDLQSVQRPQCNVWDIVLDDTPHLTMYSEQCHPSELGKPEEGVHSFVTLTEGTAIAPGAPRDNVGVAPSVILRSIKRDIEEHAMDDLQPDDHGFKIVAQLDQGTYAEEIVLEAEHLLVGADVPRLLEDVEPIQYKQEFESVALSSEEGRDAGEIDLLRETFDGDILRVGFLDRVVIRSDKDCTFEFWEGKRQKFTANNGLVVLTHLGDGEFIEDSGELRRIMYQEILDGHQDRDTPLFQKILQPEFRLPRSSSQKLSMPMQFACYELCRMLSDPPGPASEMIPFSMDMFVERPELYFMLANQQVVEAAMYEDRILEGRAQVRDVVVDLSRSILLERFETDHSIDPDEINNWCSVGKDAAWNLLEVVLSGAAVEMIRLGISFDVSQPATFAKRYANLRERLLRANPVDQSSTPLRVNGMGSRFAELSAVLSSIKSLDQDWDLVAKIARDVALKTSFYERYPTDQKRKREGLTADVFDTTITRLALRGFVRDQIMSAVTDAMERLDRKQVLNVDSVLEVITSWTMLDCERDFKEAEDVLDRVHQRDEINGIILSTIEVKRAVPQIDLSGLDRKVITQASSSCITKLGRAVVANLINAATAGDKKAVLAAHEDGFEVTE